MANKITKKITKKITIGTYKLGLIPIKLVGVIGETGGSFNLDPGTIEVGLAGDGWGRCLTILLHETMELALMQVGGRFVPSPDYAAASDGYHFVVNHDKFSEAVGRAGWFLMDAMPALANVFNKINEKKFPKKAKAKVIKKGR